MRSKQGRDFGGIYIFPPDELASRQGEYDALIIANHNHFEDIRQEAIEMGIAENGIVMPLEMIQSIGNRG